MLESAVERALITSLKKHSKGCALILKLNVQGKRGWPDRMILMQEAAAFVELKAPGKKPGALQRKMIADLAALGYSVYVVDDTKAARDLGKMLGERAVWCKRVQRVAR